MEAMKTLSALGAGWPSAPADVVACTAPNARERKKKVPTNSRKAPWRSCLMFAKRARELKGMCAEGVIGGEMEDRVDRLRGIKGGEQIHGGCKRTSSTPALLGS